MARGTLHAGKADGARRRRNAPSHDSIHLTRDDEVRGPSIVEATGVQEWLPQVVAWWETWRNSPQAQAFEATDWSRLAMLAPIVAGYWKRPSAAALGEIRMSEERLGATVVDRMRARMVISDPEATTEGGDAQVVSISSRRNISDRLGGGA